jgi:hypothetical protein
VLPSWDQSFSEAPFLGAVVCTAADVEVVVVTRVLDVVRAAAVAAGVVGEVKSWRVRGPSDDAGAVVVASCFSSAEILPSRSSAALLRAEIWSELLEVDVAAASAVGAVAYDNARPPPVTTAAAPSVARAVRMIRCMGSLHVV